MSYKRISIFVLSFITTLFLSCFNAKASSFNTLFKNVNISNGLYNNQTWCIQPLDNHTLLIGSYGAFSIYDGATFNECDLNYSKTYPISGYVMGADYRDKEGNFWIKYTNELYLFDQKRNGFVYEIDERFKRCGVYEHVKDFFMDESKQAWLLTERGKLYRCDLISSSVLVYTLPVSNKEVLINGVIQLDNRFLIFFTDGSFKCWDSNKRRILYTDNRFKKDNQRYAKLISTRINKNEILIGTSCGGLFVYNISEQSWNKLNFNDINFIKFIIDKNGNPTVITNQCVATYDRQLRQMRNIITSLPTINFNFGTESIYDAAFDWQGGLWLANIPNGLFYTHNKSDGISKYNIPDERSHIIKSIVHDDKGNIIYSNGSGIYQFKIATGTTQILFSLPNTEFFSIRNGRDDTLWISSDKGLIALKNGRTHIFNTQNTPSIPYDRCTMSTDVDGRIFACFGATHIGWLDTKHNVFHPIRFPEQLTWLYRDVMGCYYDKRNQRVIIEANLGFLSYDIRRNQLVDFFHGKNGFNNRSRICNDYLCDSKGNCWFATLNGLFIIKNDGKKIELTTEDGLSSNCIRAIRNEKDGIYWITTSGGISCIKWKEGNLNQNNLLIRNYNISEVVNGCEFINRCMVCLNGEVWCATTNKIVRLNPNQEQVSNSEEYTVNLSSLLIFDKKVSTEGMLDQKMICDRNKHEINLQYNQNFFTLNFSACNYINPSQTFYRYRLNGVDKEWNIASSKLGNAVTSYTNVPTGHYLLIIQVKDESGNWGPASKWTITITPPLWCTWWAFLIYIALLIAAAYYGLHIYKYREKLLQQIKEKRNKFIIQAAEVKPEDIEITNQDKQFLQKAVKLVEKNFSNNDYGVEQLSADLAYSRSQLYRKMQAIAGQTPIDFIHTVQLRRAAKLITGSGKSIKEIAFSVGFKDIKNFRKSFKKLYGMTPTEYQQDNIQQDNNQKD